MYLLRYILHKLFHNSAIRNLSSSAPSKHIVLIVILWSLSVFVSPNSHADWHLVDTLKGHTDAVNSIAFNPDGRLLASGSKDKTVIIWNALTGRREKTLTGHSGEIYSVAFSSDGLILASASEDGTIILWNPETGKILRTITHNGVHSITFSPDGQLLASGSWYGTIRLWNPKTGQQVQEVSAHKERVYSVTFSPDGALLASSSWDSTIKLSDLKQKEEKEIGLRGGTYARFVTFSPDGRLLASGLQDGAIKLWNPETGELISDLTVKGSPVVSLAFSSDSQLLVSEAQDHTIKIWNIKTQREITTLKGHERDVNSVAFSPKNNLLASASSDGTVKLWQDIDLSIIILDTTSAPPKTVITGSRIQGRSAIFRFSVEPLAVSDKLQYSWRLDKEDWTETWDTSVKLHDLSDGFHLFEVKAIDMDGNEDIILAEVSFYVKPTPMIVTPRTQQLPETTITKLESPVKTKNVTIHFQGTNAQSYEWILYNIENGRKDKNQADRTLKTSVELKNLSNGSYLFEVKAIGKDGEDETPAEIYFQVDFEEPTLPITIEEKTPDVDIVSIEIESRDVTIHLKGMHAQRYEWTLTNKENAEKKTGSAYGTQEALVELRDLPNGFYLFEVKAIGTGEDKQPERISFPIQIPTTQQAQPSIDEKPPEIKIVSVSQNMDNLHNFTAHFTVSSLHPPFRYSWGLDDKWKEFQTETDSSKEAKVVLEGLSSGRHVFEIKAIDSKSRENSTYKTFTINEQFPNTEIVSLPEELIETEDITIKFRGSDLQTKSDKLRYAWRVDKNKWGLPQRETVVTLKNLSKGRHLFEVIAIDTDDNEDKTPALAWLVIGDTRTELPPKTVDEQFPNTEIVNLPEGPIETEDITIEFRGSDLQTKPDKLRYKWRLDKNKEWDQLSPQREMLAKLDKLSEGWHLFEVIAIDTDDNEDSTPAAAWLFMGEINPELPNTEIVEIPQNLSKGSELIIKFTGEDLQTPTEQLQYSWRLDDGEWSDFSPQTQVSLSQKLSSGFHKFEVKAKDGDGNEDPTPAVSGVWFIKIPFYKSPTGILIIVLSVIILSSGIYLFYFFIILPYWKARRKFNPYITDKPIINPKMVFGREKLLRQINDILSESSVVLCGKEKSGKTTILRQLEQRLEKPFIPIYVDVSDISEYEFFSKLMQNIAIGCREYLPTLRSEHNGSKLSWYTFGIELYNEIIKQLKSKHGEDMKLVLLLDNINHFYRYDQEVHYYLRDFLKRFSDNLRIVCATDRIITERWGQLVSPWYDFAYLINVRPLTEKNAIQLIESPVRRIYKYSDEAKDYIKDYILEQSNCEPFKIQTFCKEIISNTRKRKIELDYVKEIQKKVKEILGKKVQTEKLKDSYDESGDEEQSKEGIPYTLNPVYGENFYGREKLIGNILSSKNRRALIIGARKMGKSSLLQQLECKLKSNSHIVLYLSLKGIDKSEEFENNFKMVGQLNEKMIFDVTFNETEDIQTVLRVINNKLQQRGKHLFLLVDDAENLAELESPFLDKLQISLEKATQINLILAGSQKIYKLREVAADWFESFPNPWILGPLTNREANALITQDKKIKVSGETIEDIREQTGNHPYFIQLLCSTLFESPKQLIPVSKAEKEKVYDKANQLGIIEQSYHLLSPLQQDIVIRIFENEFITVDTEKLRKEIDNSIGNGYNIDNEAFEGALKSLRELGYIAEDYRISNYFLRKWLENEDLNHLRGVRLLRKISMDFGYLSEAEQKYAYQKTKSATKAEDAKVKKAAIETMGAIMFYLSSDLKEEALRSTFWSILSDGSKEPQEFREAAAKVLIFLLPHLSGEQRKEERQIRFLDESIKILDKPSLRRIREVDDFLEQYKHISEFSDYLRDW